MTQEFRQIVEGVYASPQIGLAEVELARAMGVSLIVNNRPEGESPDQVPGAEIEAAARAAGIGYIAIPVTHAGFSEPQVQAMAAALEGASGPVLAYCRSGTRSTRPGPRAGAGKGPAPEETPPPAPRAGYDVSPIRTLIDMLAARAA